MAKKSKEIEEAEERGFEAALSLVSIPLLDGTENNQIRAEAVKRAREIRADVKRIAKEMAEGFESVYRGGGTKWVLLNYKELGKPVQPYIKQSGDTYKLVTGTPFGTSYHNSLSNAKRKFRSEYVRQSAPKLKWGKNVEKRRK